MLSGTVSDEPSSVYVIVMVPSLLNLYPNAPEKAWKTSVSPADGLWLSKKALILAWSSEVIFPLKFERLDNVTLWFSNNPAIKSVCWSWATVDSFLFKSKIFSAEVILFNCWAAISPPTGGNTSFTNCSVSLNSAYLAVRTWLILLIFVKCLFSAASVVSPSLTLITTVLYSG